MFYSINLRSYVQKLCDVHLIISMECYGRTTNWSAFWPLGESW